MPRTASNLRALNTSNKWGNKWAVACTLFAIVLTMGCDVVVRNEPDVNVQRLAQTWPPYHPPAVEGQIPTSEQASTAAIQANPTPAAESGSTFNKLVPVRRAEDWDLPETAMDSLGRIGAPAVPALIEALDHNDPGRREQAAKVLARIGPEAQQSVDALVIALNDGNVQVRKAAARALGQIGPAAEDAVLPLLEIIEQDSSPSGQPNLLPTSANEPLPGSTE